MRRTRRPARHMPSDEAYRRIDRSQPVAVPRSATAGREAASRISALRGKTLNVGRNWPDINVLFAVLQQVNQIDRVSRAGSRPVIHTCHRCDERLILRTASPR